MINIKNEITDIIKSGSKIAIDSNIETAKFELQTLTQNIELKYQTNEDQLKLELAKGAITQNWKPQVHPPPDAVQDAGAKAGCRHHRKGHHRSGRE